MHVNTAMQSAIFDIDYERATLFLQYDLMKNKIISSEFSILGEEEKIKLLSRFFNCSKALGKSFKQGVISGINFQISQNNLNEITFGSQDNGDFVVISEQGIYSEICVQDINYYAKLKSHDFTVILNKKVYIVDGEINEYIEIYDVYLKEKNLKEFYDVLKPLCTEIVSKNPEYTLSSSRLGFFRTEISPEEKIKSHTDLTDEILPAYMTKQSFQKGVISETNDNNVMIYSDLINLSEEYNKRYLNVYSVIQEALNSDYILGNKLR